jgi:hypothetical protein
MEAPPTTGVPEHAQGKVYWYRWFRAAAYYNAVGGIIWTLLIVLPFPPFSELPPVLIGGGAGTWFLLAYVLYLVVGVGGFGALSIFLFTLEAYENRAPDPKLMLLGFVILNLGVLASVLLLAAAGVVGGFAQVLSDASGSSEARLLSPYVLPVSVGVVAALAGGAITLLGMVRAKASRG